METFLAAAAANAHLAQNRRRLSRGQSSLIRHYVEQYTGVNLLEDLTVSIFSLPVFLSYCEDGGCRL
jgi:hypothetical protein